MFKLNDTERNPFALVSDSDVDGLHELGWHYRMINSFAKYEVGQMYNCTLKDFLEFPMSQCEFMIDCAKNKFDQKNKLLADAHDEQKRAEEENRRRQEKLAQQAQKTDFHMPRL